MPRTEERERDWHPLGNGGVWIGPTLYARAEINPPKPPITLEQRISTVLRQIEEILGIYIRPLIISFNDNNKIEVLLRIMGEAYSEREQIGSTVRRVYDIENEQYRVVTTDHFEARIRQLIQDMVLFTPKGRAGWLRVQER